MMKKILWCLAFLAVAVSAAYAVPPAAYAADAETNKQILKDALVGAVTGAVAVEATKDEPESSKPEIKGDNSKKSNVEPKKSKEHKSKEGHQPPGWDKGKKTGWGGADTPPGHHKGKQ